MEKRHGGLVSVLCLLCAGALAWLPSVAAGSAEWHPDPARPDGLRSMAGIVHGTPARHHHALPPLSAPAPTTGADLPPSRAPGRGQPAPHFGFPLQPTFGFAEPPVGPSGGEGYPFIGSNPTVPLPTGMTDTSTVLPMPDTGAGTATKVAGNAASVRVRVTMIGIALMFTICSLVLEPLI